MGGDQLGDRPEALFQPLRVDIGHGAGVGLGVHLQQHVELFEGHFVEERHESKLFFAGIRQQDQFLLRQIEQHVRVSAAFQDDPVKLSDKRDNRGRGDDRHAVAGLDAGRIIDHQAGEFLIGCFHNVLHGVWFEGEEC